MLHNILSFTISFLIGQFGHVNFRRETFFHSNVIDFIIIVYLLDMFDLLNFLSDSPMEYYLHIFTSYLKVSFFTFLY